jgi:hypothetical protein
MSKNKAITIKTNLKDRTNRFVGCLGKTKTNIQHSSSSPLMPIITITIYYY